MAHCTQTKVNTVEQVNSVDQDGAHLRLHLYNSMSRTKEEFKASGDPSTAQRVTMYVCGVTVYDLSHIGHARAYVSFDILYRYLRHLGYDVLYCRNFTDIDDKIIDRANKLGEDPLHLSKRFAAEFHKDMDTLGCERPGLEPLATEHIEDMIDSISKIMDNGHAYAVDGDVFFDVSSLPGYGKLSGRQLDDNRAGERVSVDSRKKNPGDFALWKSAKPGEPTWESPWGPGRPGWHIECSSMIRSLLGETVDIHGGGSDLLFPHHENELAQARASSSCCSDHTSDPHFFARWWVHNGFVNVDSEKMSKSLGNFFTIREIVQLYHPMALRFFLIGTQYRQAINYTQRALEESSDRLFYLYQTMKDAEEILADCKLNHMDRGLLQEIYSALGDDLNTPLALAAFSPALKSMNDLIHTKKGKKRSDRLEILAGTMHALNVALGLLGMHPHQQSKTFSDLLIELKSTALRRAQMTEEHVETAIEQRAVARAAKDYDAADLVRKELESKGIFIMDTPSGTTWRPGCPVTA